MEKTFVLDTNVLLFDANSIFKFGSNKVFIPLIVVEELDRFKKDQNENGRNARYFSRLVDDLRSHGPLSQGVNLENGGKLFISATPEYKGKHVGGIDLKINDNLILASALILQEAGENVILITKDINLRLKGDAVGIVSEDYGTSDIELTELYSGQKVLEMDVERIAEFERNRFLPLTETELSGVQPNEYLIMHEPGNPHKNHFS